MFCQSLESILKRTRSVSNSSKRRSILMKENGMERVNFGIRKDQLVFFSTTKRRETNEKEIRKDVVEERKQSRKILQIIYEDEDYCIFNKPGGISVSGEYKKEEKERGRMEYLDMVESYFDSQQYNHFPSLLHRLDKVCSGIMVFGKHKKAETHFQNLLQFNPEQVNKGYIAIVRGSPKESQGILKGTIIRTKSNIKRFSIVKSGKGDHNRVKSGFNLISSNLVFTPSSFTIKPRDGLKETEDQKNEKRRDPIQASIVGVRIYTGKSHQVRATCSALASPIIGDTLYGGGKFLNKNIYLDNSPLEETALLHSSYISFPSFRDGKPLYQLFCSPWSWWNEEQISRVPDEILTQSLLKMEKKVSLEQKLKGGV
eukprot:TRINITY_DN13191_c0_g1_i1.p1 TRINITY_DN13191_c0_g1~~TRINITY_DN13191_c0_g1_i1.p1  ORF type:complete len:371 (-),score=80.34 TRINITY_DN13191_c0_g1_i1:4-1116(-)